ncbi:MAG: protein-L-isoaspartate O-methyltransferase, partial [Pseudomonadota bacterium]
MRIIRAMLSLPREAFVPREMRSVCYMDQDVPVHVSNEAGGSGQTRYLLAPRTQAKLIQALDLG